MTIPRPDVVNWNEIDTIPSPPPINQGPPGPQGPVGPTGPPGAPGVTGANGIQGNQGPPGPGWKSMTHDPGNNENTGDPVGTLWFNSITGQYWRLDSVSPVYTWTSMGYVVGQQGAVGPQGPQGPIGPTGVTGPAGAQGPQGATGPAGAQGAQGLTGPPGAQGPIGPAGPTGSAGPGVAAGGTAGQILAKIDAANFNTNWQTLSVTSAQIVDGTIVAADIADAGVTNAKLGPDVARANLLTNGGFEIWQRGNGPFTTTSAYSADRWVLQNAGGLSVSRDASNQERGTACLAVTASGASGFVYQVFVSNGEGSQLQGQTVSLSVRVKTSTANALRIQLFDNSGLSAASPYHTGSGTYQTLTATLVLSAGTVNVQARIITDAACTAYVDSAMLVIGSQPADYAPLHPADDLARCLRYYEIITGQTMYATGFAASATGFFLPLRFLVPKPVTPTITISAPGDFVVANGGAGLAVTSFTPGAVTVGGCYLQGGVASGLTFLNAATVQGINANSKITIEANP